MPVRIRRDQFVVHVTMEGINWGGNNVWDTKTGGQTDSDATTIRTGASAQRVSLGGYPNTDNLVCTRLYEDRDHAHIQELIDRVGRGRCTVQQQPVDENRNVYGNPFVWTGTLKRVSVPDVDLNSTDGAYIEIEIVPDGPLVKGG